jgi:hypothetical protein
VGGGLLLFCLGAKKSSCFLARYDNVMSVIRVGVRLQADLSGESGWFYVRCLPVRPVLTFPSLTAWS